MTVNRALQSMTMSSKPLLVGSQPISDVDADVASAPPPISALKTEELSYDALTPLPPPPPSSIDSVGLKDQLLISRISMS
jgi:hypothetical protein